MLFYGFGCLKFVSNAYFCELMPSRHHSLFSSIEFVNQTMPEIIVPLYFKYVKGDW
jgi:hypothetical protein